VKQSCGKNDEKEPYREDLIFTSVSKLACRKMRAPVCAASRRTKDSPMMVLMPAMLRSSCAFRVVKAFEKSVLRYYMCSARS
jgi:hypothetical protein